jgi:hypothetical protein
MQGFAILKYLGAIQGSDLPTTALGTEHAFVGAGSGHPLAGRCQVSKQIHGGASRKSFPYYSIRIYVSRPLLQVMAANESRQPLTRIKRSAMHCIRPGRLVPSGAKHFAAY